MENPHESLQMLEKEDAQLQAANRSLVQVMASMEGRLRTEMANLRRNFERQAQIKRERERLLGEAWGTERD